MMMDVSAVLLNRFDRGRTLVDTRGRRKRGLQNRLKWPLRASFVCVCPQASSVSRLLRLASGVQQRRWQTVALAAFNGSPRIQIAISERAAAIC